MLHITYSFSRVHQTLMADVCVTTCAAPYGYGVNLASQLHLMCDT